MPSHTSVDILMKVTQKQCNALQFRQKYGNVTYYFQKTVIYNVLHFVSNLPNTGDTLRNGAIGRLGGDELLNIFVIWFFFAHKKYSCSFIK